MIACRRSRMTPAVAGLALFGVALGRWCGRQRRPYWLAGYIVPLAIVMLISSARWLPKLETALPFRWLMAGRTEFALLALVCTLLLMTPLSRLSRRREKIVLAAFIAVFTIHASVLPFLGPALNYHRLVALETMIDAHGVCLQSNDYTCGPAAAVTALHALGVAAEEGQLAIAAHTSRFAGTPADSLCSAIERQCGVPCRQEYFREVEDLRGKGPVIVIVKFGFMIDHYVTVLALSPETVTTGDPLVGRTELTRDEFNRKWRKCGIVLNKGAVMTAR